MEKLKNDSNLEQVIEKVNEIIYILDLVIKKTGLNIERYEEKIAQKEKRASMRDEAIKNLPPKHKKTMEFLRSKFN